MRLPYAPSSPPLSSPDVTTVEAVYHRLQARRSPNPLLNLDLTLLHAPPVADGWSSFLGAIRTKTSIPTGLREVAICRVAVLNGAAYELAHHAPIAMGEGGVSEEGMRSIKEADYGTLPSTEQFEERHDEGGILEGLDEKQWVVLAYTDRMTREVKVPSGQFERLKRFFNEREIVEITATIAAYNCVSRFLVALDVGEMEEKGLI